MKLARGDLVSLQRVPLAVKCSHIFKKTASHFGRQFERTRSLSSRHMPGGGDIGTTAAADRTQHSRHQFIERGLI
jgi:hypothetical protein